MSLFELDPTGGARAGSAPPPYGCDTERLLARSGAAAPPPGARPRLDTPWPPYGGPAALADARLAAAAAAARAEGLPGEAVAFVRALDFNVKEPQPPEGAGGAGGAEGAGAGAEGEP